MKEPHWKHLTFDFNISLIWLKLSYQLLSYVLKYSTPLNNVGGGALTLHTIKNPNIAL